MFLGFIYFLICNNRKSTHFRINGNKNKQKEQKKKKRKKANAFNRTIGRNMVVLLNISTS